MAPLRCQYETTFEQSKKPQIRSFIDPAIRGTIRDRFNIPLALNKMQYDATLIYAAIRNPCHSVDHRRIG